MMLATIGIISGATLLGVGLKMYVQELFFGSDRLDLLYRGAALILVGAAIFTAGLS